MPPPTLDQVIFPEQANHNFSRILGDLKRANLSITNRLRSISHDADFVGEVADVLGLPLVANERCGSWYIDPARKAGSAYFKSTDGHTGQWKFSLRRLNLHLLELIGENDGHPRPAHPANAVSASEAAQMAALLPQFVASFLSLAIDLDPLRRRLRGKPLRPQQRRGGGAILKDSVAALRGQQWHTVVCCTCSRRAAAGTEMAEGGYIQGAGDDTENWALGLTGGVLAVEGGAARGQEGELPGLIGELVRREEEERRRREGLAVEGGGGGGGGGGEVKEVAKGVFVGTLAAEEAAMGEGACVVSLVPRSVAQGEWVKGKRHLEVGLGKSKAASRMLRDALPQICEFALRFLREPATEAEGSPGKKVAVLCDSGKDLSVGSRLAVYCWCFDDAGNVRQDGKEVSFNKTAIRVRLGHIVTAMPEANPSRATLQSVNSFLMDWRK
ncbi:hypothetical protein NEMBOFW57_005215 [Staphylotrichum longicolle]|uniref:tRNA A64-2'-O-ribosylphosphate transferase n=1 Tax=Staphylotrichum longicolle TaxID=669026 RepID=A0AAD4HZG8_9PEZI|nr:hypothetical protein NEMBOFW57_005215 [Staphylotrichum longicolle]